MVAERGVLHFHTMKTTCHVKGQLICNKSVTFSRKTSCKQGLTQDFYSRSNPFPKRLGCFVKCINKMWYFNSSLIHSIENCTKTVTTYIKYIKLRKLFFWGGYTFWVAEVMNCSKIPVITRAKPEGTCLIKMLVSSFLK